MSDSPPAVPVRAQLALLGVLAFGLTLRLWTIGSGIPHTVGVDEPEILRRAVGMMKSGDFNPHFFDYGGLTGITAEVRVREEQCITADREMLRRAEERARAAGLTNIRFCRSAIEPGRLGSRLYDRVILATVLGEIPDREGALREICRALKPGGFLSVTEMVFDPHYQSRDTVLRLAGEAGLRERAFFGNRMAYTLNLEKPKWN